MDVMGISLAIHGKDRIDVLTMTRIYKYMNSNDSIHGWRHKRILNSHG